MMRSCLRSLGALSLLALAASCSGTEGRPNRSGDSGGGTSAAGAGGSGVGTGAGSSGVGPGAGGGGAAASGAGGNGGTFAAGGASGSTFGGAGGGNAGSGGNAGNAGSAGSAGSAAGSAGSGGRTYSTDPATFFGEARCQGFAICESFETTDVGELPAGFTLGGYGTRTVGVSDVLAARGDRSLRFDVPAQGAITAWLVRGDLGALGSAHFGRSFVHIASPAPTEFVHFDIFAGNGPWDGHSNEVRWASTGTGVGTAGSNWSFIYNVQPSGSGSGAEFGSEGDRSAHPRVGEFMCLEWWFDADEQEAQFYLDGSAVEYLHIDTERAEIPVFDTLAVGFAKYQNTGAFLVHVDEVAYDPERIGCNN